MKLKIGDKVRIKSLNWYNLNKDKDGFVHCGDRVFDNYMSVFCESVVTIGEVDLYGYGIREDMQCRTWTDEMIECKVEEETTDCEKCGLTHNSTRCLFMDNCPHNKQKTIIEIPEDYVIKDENGNVINAKKIVLEKKKKEYPKTFEECCKILGLLNVDLCFNTDYRSFDASKEQWKRLGLMNQFYQLLICRDAYWKIAGEEMGLGKPWEPDWNHLSDKWVLFYTSNRVGFQVAQTRHSVFAFPTEEMRDAFYENFKELIEICKELL